MRLPLGDTLRHPAVADPVPLTAIPGTAAALNRLRIFPTAGRKFPTVGTGGTPIGQQASSAGFATPAIPCVFTNDTHELHPH